MRRLIAAVVLAATSLGFVAQADPQPPVEHVTVLAGEGLWSVAARLCPHDVPTVFSAMQQANPWYTVGLHPGTVLHVPEGVCPPETTSTTSTTVPETTSTTEPPAPTGFPTPDSTGPRDTCTDPAVFTGTLTTTGHGQVIECTVIFGNLRIQHNDVTVSDVTIHGTAAYMIHVRNLGGSTGNPCPTGVRVEYTEVDASGVAADLIPVYARCGASFDHLYVHGGGAAVRLVSNSTVTNSYVRHNRREPDQHRTALSMHGGTNNRVIGNTLICEAPPGVSGSGGCSAALSVYGDFGLPDGFLAQGNLLATSGGYCMYGGSGHPTSNQFPDGVNVDIIGNHFSTMFNPDCGIFGVLTAYEALGLRGNDRCGNVWHETGLPVWPSDPTC